MKQVLFVFALVSLSVAGIAWTFGFVSPRTGPYWTFYGCSAVVFAILYAGTEGK